MIDPAQARTDLYAQLDAAQALTGGIWDDADNPSPALCTSGGGGGGDKGVTFTGTRRSNDTASADTLAKVAALWKGMGFTTRAENNMAPYKLVIATSKTDPENILTFGLATTAMYLEGQGACGKGDPNEWLLRVEKEIAERKAHTPPK